MWNIEWLYEIEIKSMLHECEIEKEPAELLVGWARPVDGEAGGDSIRWFILGDKSINDSKYMVDYRLHIAFDEEAAHVKQVFSGGKGRIIERMKGYKIMIYITHDSKTEQIIIYDFKLDVGSWITNLCLFSIF